MLRRVSRHIENSGPSAAVATAQSVRGKSMLHPESLISLYQCASSCDGAILEIGSFVGGATIVMAKAAAKNPHPIIAIEVGDVERNPTMPRADILADLRANLERP
jgi:predicted O-methyltransferase YrrM